MQVQNRYDYIINIEKHPIIKKHETIVRTLIFFPVIQK